MYRKLAGRRPSGAMVVALIALFVALGGVGYAQLSLSNDSVGTAQLQNSAVTSAKIANGSIGNFKLKFGSVGPRKLINNSVGVDQINADQVQSRVFGSCQGAGAIATIATTGNVTCAATPPQEFGAATSAPVALGVGGGTAANDSAAATTIVSKTLPGGSAYLALADPNVLLNNVAADGAGLAAQQVEVRCTLAVAPASGATTAPAPGNGVSVTRTLIDDLPAETGAMPTTPQQGGSIAMALPAPPVAAGSVATVSCTDAFTGRTAPSVTVSSDVNAIQTANNN
jgi:hypothetical protein